MYKYYNHNPNKEKLPDCVCRAISLATDTDYYTVMSLLKQNGVCYDCDKLTVACYSKMLSKIGYKEYDGAGYRVSDILHKHPHSTILMRLDGHLTCGIDGLCYDIWDCTDKVVDRYWIVE